jgi:hypothetical protein
MGDEAMDTRGPLGNGLFAVASTRELESISHKNFGLVDRRLGISRSWSLMNSRANRQLSLRMRPHYPATHCRTGPSKRGAGGCQIAMDDPVA